MSRSVIQPSNYVMVDSAPTRAERREILRSARRKAASARADALIELQRLPALREVLVTWALYRKAEKPVRKRNLWDLFERMFRALPDDQKLHASSVLEMALA
tara:strand:+ start:2222 stop:2527 length:306 start_codon:yes stop_codon:yes gene_type:complete